MQSMDVNPIGKNKIEDDCLYSPTEKKVIKPSKATLTMYARNNKESAEIVEMLMGDYGKADYWNMYLLQPIHTSKPFYIKFLETEISINPNSLCSRLHIIWPSGHRGFMIL